MINWFMKDPKINLWCSGATLRSYDPHLLISSFDQIIRWCNPRLLISSDPKIIRWFDLNFLRWCSPHFLRSSGGSILIYSFPQILRWCNGTVKNRNSFAGMFLWRAISKIGCWFHWWRWWCLTRRSGVQLLLALLTSPAVAAAVPVSTSCPRYYLYIREILCAAIAGGTSWYL